MFEFYDDAVSLVESWRHAVDAVIAAAIAAADRDSGRLEYPIGWEMRWLLLPPKRWWR